MNQHNHVVFQALSDYLQINRPGYGVFIKGDWGCGKTFFVKQWVNNFFANKINALAPVYVSLYGLKTTAQIDEVINQILSPFFHGKFMKRAEKYAKLIGSIAVRYNVDIEGDNDPEQVVCTIDPKKLLEASDEAVDDKRVVIFDDIERSKMDVGELMGYINYFVEQVGCHVVIIGDYKNIKNQNRFNVIKEKTIGREYNIEPEIEEALDIFIKEIDDDGRLGLAGKRTIIKYCFSVSRVNNLRILRQSLFDYKMFISHLPDDITKAAEFENIQLYLLANFIAIYAEYKSGNLVMERYNDILVTESYTRLSINKGEIDKIPAMPATDTKMKYQKTGLTESHRLLGQGYIICVMSYLLDGAINEDFLREEVKRDRSTPWEKLSQYWNLDNEDFNKCLNHTAGYLESGKFDGIDTMLMATCSMLTVIKKGMTNNYTSKKVLEWSKVLIDNKYFPACRTLDDLHRLRGHAQRCLEYYRGDSITEEIKELNSYIEDAFVKTSPNTKNALTVILDSLSDDKINTLINIYQQAIPDHSVTYSSYAIFSEVDPEKFVDGFIKLSNEFKVQVIQLVKQHYHQAFSFTNAKDFVHYYEKDLCKLPEIVKRLKKAAEHESLVNKDNILTLAETLTESAETIQVLVYERDKNT